MDIGVSGFGPDSAIDRAMQMNENFAVETGKQPIIFENPMYAARDSIVNVDQQAEKQPSTSAEATQGTEAAQESKWNFFKRKLKQSTNFENPIYAEMEKEQQEVTAAVPPPSPSLNTDITQRKDQTPAYVATEDTFQDTANLVKEDSEV